MHDCRFDWDLGFFIKKCASRNTRNGFLFSKRRPYFTSLLALVVFCVGGWKLWSANDFAQNAIVKQGVFRGYHLQRQQSLARDTSGLKKYRMVEEYLPMFAYEAEGRRYEMTGTDSHFFRHLRGRVNESVKILVSPDDPKVARLGDALSLYGNGALMAISSLIFILLPWYGVRYIDRWRDAAVLLIEKGAEIRDIKPEAVFHMIQKGDAAMLGFIVGKGFDLNQSHASLSYGDQAVLLGRAGVVWLIQKYNGPFKAPSAFVALAANDADALRDALEVSAGSDPKFRGLTLERFAKKIGRTDLLVLTWK